MLDDSHPALPHAVLREAENHGAPENRSDTSNGGGHQGVPGMQQSSTGCRSRRNRYVAVAAVAGAILVAAGAGVWGLRGYLSTPGQGAIPPSPPVVTVALPLRENVTKRTEFTGQFSAVNQVELLAQVSGYLTEIHFQDGQIVRKGDLLFIIDPRPYEIHLELAVAQRQTALASLALANKEVNRATHLAGTGAVPVELLDQRTQRQQAAVAAVNTAEAAIHAAQLDLEFTRIVAPFSGRLSMRRVSIGSLVRGASSPTALTSIVSLDPLYLDFDMSEADYVAYRRATRAGTKTTVQVSLDGEQPWSRIGELDFLDNRIDRGSGTMHARATVSNPDLTIVPGQFARIRVPVSPAQPELLVPDSALVTDQSTKMVMVLREDGTVVPKQVEIGALEDNAMRVIAHGLLPNDQVVINGLMRLRPGLKVEAHLTPLPITAKK